MSDTVETGAPGAPGGAGDGTRVLVIDDSNTIRRSAEIFLRQGGYQVVLAEDGFDALAKVNDHQPHLIFCDILMPRLDGYQTCAIIKRNPRFSGVPVIMALGEIDRVSRRLAELIESISSETQREAQSANIVAANIQHIFAVTEQTGEGTRSTSQLVRELSKSAEELRASVARFKIA